MMALLNRVITLTVLAGLLASCQSGDESWRDATADPELLHEAVTNLTDVIVHDIFSPPQASRVYAYATVAAYEALVQDSAGLQTLAGQLNGLTETPKPNTTELDFGVASLAALLKVSQTLVFSEERISSYRDSEYERLKKAGMPDRLLNASAAYGEQVADHILDWANKDNYAQTRTMPKFAVTREQGRWQPTPPAYMDAIEPHWNKIRPFVLDSANQFVPPPPTAFDTTDGSPFMMETQEVYQVGVELTEEQQTIAAFWDCNPYVMNIRGHVMFATKKITPGGHWMGITTIASRTARSDRATSASAHALTAVALADAFIASWDEKYRSNLIRPETVINTHIDESWQPLLQTPPFPEYTSGHSVISAAAATALTSLYGGSFAFNDTSEVVYGLPAREFDSFLAASREAAISRLYGGIHYRPAIDNGFEQGLAVGDVVTSRIRLGKEDEVTAASHGEH